MSNPIFIYDSVRPATLTASGGSAAGYPTTNLQDDRYATLWKSGATTQNQTLKAQFAVAKDLDHVKILNHNIASLGLTSLDIEQSANGSSWTQAASVNAYADPLYIPFTLVNKAYARLVFVKGSALTVEPQIGMLYIGARVDMPLYSNRPERGQQSDTIVAEAIGGLKYSSSLRGAREAWKLDFGKCPALQLYGFMKLVVAVNGIQYPFWFCDMDGNWHFVRFRKNYLPYVGVGNVNFPIRGIEMEEERVGLAMSLPGSYTVPAPS